MPESKCWKCKRKKLEFVKDYEDKNKWIRILYLCKNCGAESNRIKKRMNKYKRTRCPKCWNKTLSRKGKYFTQRKPHWHNRFFCSSCKRSCTFNKRIVVSRWDLKVNIAVMRLVNLKTLNQSKYDNRKIPYLSSRKICDIIKKKYKINISKTAVAKLIKKYRKIDSDPSLPPLVTEI